MNSTPGRLTGSGIRNLPPARIPPMLARLKLRHRKGFRVESARYRISGFRDPNTGAWISRDPANGQYYRVAGRARAGSKRAGQAARKRTAVRPTQELVGRSNMIALEVEIDRGRGPRIYYVSLPGLR